MLELHEVQLQSISLLEINAKAAKAPATPGAAPGLLVDFSSSAEASSERIADCSLTVTLKFDADDLGETEAPFDISATVRGTVESSMDLTPQQWSLFAGLQGVLLLWPYMRELITEMTRRMDIRPPVVLPVLKIPTLQPAPEADDHDDES